VLTTPYFVPGEAMLAALISAPASTTTGIP
jgi:hypothetical protein